MKSAKIYDAKSLMNALWRQHRLIGLVTGGFVVLALFYLLITPTKYTAETTVLLDESLAGVVTDITSRDDQEIKTTTIESQVEIIHSRHVAEAVLKQRKDEEYLEAVKEKDLETQEELISELLEGLTVEREGNTYLITVQYTARDAQEAADLANAFVQAYIFEQLSSQQTISVEGAKWLQTRIRELQQKTNEANKAVQQFRDKHSLIASEGRLINEEQLRDMNDKLGAARAESASAKALYEHSKEVIESQNIDAALAEALDNDVINNMRIEYLSAKKKYASLRRKLGANHEAVKKLRQDIGEYEGLIFREMERIARTHLNDYEVSVARERSLEKSMEGLIGRKIDNDTLLSELGNLERQAETYDKLYQDYLEKFENMTQQQTFPLGDARVITQASPPVKASHPRSLLILAIALLVGGGVASLLALYLDAQDESLKSGEDIRESLGMVFLGFIPKVNRRIVRNTKFKPTAKNFQFINNALTQSIDDPLSVAAETVRQTKAHVDRRAGSGSVVIGVTSTVPNEGKSTFSVNMALGFAKGGAKCLLIDSDIRNPSVGIDHFEGKVAGLQQLLTGEASLQDILIIESRTNLHILPAAGSRRETLIGDFNPEKMSALIQAVLSGYDYVILDLPPLDATSDVFALSPSIDQFLLVAEWAKTSRNQLQSAIRNNEIEKEKITGVILNKADMEQMVKYHHYKLYPEYTSYSHTKSD